MAIPKIIHYVWVGPAPKPQTVEKCIESWRNFCPDYEIREWGDADLARLGNRYALEAVENKKYAFASDVLRLHALKHHGGIYMDTDVVVTASLDRFLDNRFFSGYENWHGLISPITALMGAEKGHKIISDLLAEYDDIPFVKPDGTFNETTNTSRITQYLKDKYGVTPPYNEAKTLELGEVGRIYPSWFFCIPQTGKKNYTIHLFNASWRDPWGRKHYRTVGSKLELVRFKRQTPGKGYPLVKGEKIVFIIPSRLSGRKKIALIWKGKI